VRHNVSGGRVHVATGSDAQGSHVTIENDGQIIPPTELDRLFRPFERLEAGRRHQQIGHGLGLAIVQAIANAHGATVEARARPVGGLTITVRFPSVTSKAGRSVDNGLPLPTPTARQRVG
jgi:signal transduction histidine kinase